MTFDRICINCGEVFKCSNRQQKCCCVDCRNEYRRAYRKRWLEAHPNYMTAYFVEHRERYTRKARDERKAKRGHDIRIIYQNDITPTT